MIDTKDIAWAAGFIEGEGSFSMNMSVQAAQVQQEPLDRLRRLFGGSIGAYQPRHTPNAQLVFYWSVSGRTAAGVMMTIFVLMSPKRQNQIRRCLEVWRRKPARNSPICQKGHDKRIVGTVPQNGSCKKCNQMRAQAKRVTENLKCRSS